MSVFVDTSALFALIDPGDPAHEASTVTLSDLADRDEMLVTTNYVVVETTALIQRRLGAAGTILLHRRFVPALEVVWVDEATHVTGAEALLASRSAAVSLVDHVSFEVMRQRGIETAFAFDADFARAGFRVVPGRGR